MFGDVFNMNTKAISLLLSLSLGVGAISLAAYVSKDNSHKDINQSVQATGENVITLDYTTGSYTKVTDTFSVGGGSITMTGVKNDADKIPAYNSTTDCVYYYYHNTSGYGSGTIFTMTGVSITKVVLTAHNSYAYDVKYKVNNGDAILGTWSNSVMTIDNIKANSTFEFYNAELHTYQVRLDKIAFEYVNTADFTAVETFCTSKMHPEISFDTKGTGDCKKWYVDAKAALVALGEDRINIFKTNSYFFKFHERYLAWADANGDTSPYSGDGISKSNSININNSNNDMGLLILSISSFTTSLLLLSAMVYDFKKKHE